VTIRSQRNPKEQIEKYKRMEPDDFYLDNLFVKTRKISIRNQDKSGREIHEPSQAHEEENGLQGDITVIISEEKAQNEGEREYLITFILPCLVDPDKNFFDYFRRKIRSKLKEFIEQLGIEYCSSTLDYLLDCVFVLVMYYKKLDDELMVGSMGLPLLRSEEINLHKGKIFLTKNVIHLIWTEYIPYQEPDSAFPNNRIFKLYSMIPAMLSRLYTEEYFLEKRLSDISEKMEKMMSSAEPDLDSLLEASRNISYVFKLIQEEIGENVFDEPTIMEVYKKAMDVCGIKQILETLKERAEIVEGTVTRLISCWTSSQTSESSRSLLLLSRSSSAMEKAFSSINVAISVVALLSLISIFCDLMSILGIRPPPMTPLEEAALLAMPIAICIATYLYIRQRISATRAFVYKLDLKGRWSNELEKASCYCEQVDPIRVAILRKSGLRGLKYEARLTFRGEELISAEVELDRPAPKEDLRKIEEDLKKYLARN